MNILEKVEVEYETFEGWKSSISDCKTFDSLPANAKKYIKFIEDFLQVPGKEITPTPKRSLCRFDFEMKVYLDLNVLLS
jgi:adenylosuccinate synthase